MNIVNLKGEKGFVTFILLILGIMFLGMAVCYLKVIDVKKGELRLTIRKALDGAVLNTDVMYPDVKYINQSKAYDSFVSDLAFNLNLNDDLTPSDSNNFITGKVTIQTFTFIDDKTCGLPAVNPLDSAETLECPSIYAVVSIPVDFGVFESLYSEHENKSHALKCAVVVSAETLP